MVFNYSHYQAISNTTTNALAFYANSSTTAMDISEAKVFLTDEGLFRIGKAPTAHSDAFRDGGVTEIADGGNPKIKLDVEGSAKIDGFIYFFDYYFCYLKLPAHFASQIFFHKYYA